MTKNDYEKYRIPKNIERKKKKKRKGDEKWTNYKTNDDREKEQ